MKKSTEQFHAFHHTIALKEMTAKLCDMNAMHIAHNLLPILTPCHAKEFTSY